MKVPFARPMIGKAERDAVLETLKHPQLTNAGQVRAFEERFQETVGGGRAVAVSSCMAALHLSFLGQKSHTRVIMPALNHPAMAHAAELSDLVPVFVDVLPETGNINPEEVNNAIDDKTSTIAFVHFLGQPCDMGRISEISRRCSLWVIEDCALALGSSDDTAHVGLRGDIGCFSFYPTKHITTGEGGIFLTKHYAVEAFAQNCREFARASPDRIGLNYRMTEMQGAMGVEQLRRFPKLLAARKQNFDVLKDALRDFEMLGGGSYYALSVIMPDDVSRETIRERLLESHIETSVYYAPVVPLIEYYRRKYGYREGQFPVAERIAARSITLPVGPHLTTEHMVYMAATLKRAIHGVP